MPIGFNSDSIIGLYSPGSVMQVLQTSDNTYSSYSTALYTWLSLTITRRLSNSKILVIFSGNYATSAGTDTSVRLKNAIDGYISIGSNTSVEQSSTSTGTDKGGVGVNFMIPSNVVFLHTPTSALVQTYSIDIWSESSQTIYPNGESWRGGGQQAHNTQANLVLMEIAP